MNPPRAVGRFAPTPSGLLHAGSLVAALGSWLDARSRGGRWRVRIEDLDTPRNAAGADAGILDQLARLGLESDGPVWRQSDRRDAYQAALAGLRARGLAYACACSRRDLALMPRAGTADDEAGERIHPGACRARLDGRRARSTRLRTAGAGVIEWHDRRLGPQRQDLEREVGDFVVERADGVVAYQLAVVVDDAAQGVTDVVRGEDLASNTARQIWLQRALGLPRPRYLHLPLVHGDDGAKLSKQNGAVPVGLGSAREVMAALAAAGRVLGLAIDAGTPAAWRDAAIAAWRSQWVPEGGGMTRP